MNPEQEGKSAFVTELTAISVARTVIITAYHLVYPFLPAFARGMGVDLKTAGLAVSARSLFGIGAPFLGPVADLRGRRFSLVTSCFLFAGGMGIVALLPSYTTFVAALLIAHLARILFDPAMQAYIGDHVRYARRGTVFALVELSWSASFLLIIPAIGWLISRGGWHAPFRWLAAAAGAAGFLLSRTLPANEIDQEIERTFLGNLRATFLQGRALSGLAFGALISVGNDLVAIVYGAWLEGEFGLQVAALGLASTVVGLGLLAGEVAAWGLVDRMGKKRALIIGVLISALTSLGLPFLDHSLALALIGLFLFYASFEFMLVTSMPLMTELVPGARATFMSGYVASFSAGRALGAWLGPALFSYGLLANGLAAAGVFLLAIVVLSLFVPVE